MNVQELFRHDLERLDQQIDDIEGELSTKLAGDLSRGNRLSLNQYRKQRELLGGLFAATNEIDAAITYCRTHLIAAEERHRRLIASGHAHDPSHADEWWDAETELAYLTECLQKLEAARSKG